MRQTVVFTNRLRKLLLFYLFITVFFSG